jgi:ASC-1-like (ASCH) protein
MHHLAIMKKLWGLAEKILDGRKKIESRWYLAKRAPWDKIKKGDIVYFKNSGEPVSIKAEVEKVKQFCDLTPKKVKDILNEYGRDDGIGKEKIREFYELFKNKNYCILVFLKESKAIAPFEINKKGFGAMAAWISVGDISKLKCKEKRPA